MGGSHRRSVETKTPDPKENMHSGFKFVDFCKQLRLRVLASVLRGRAELSGQHGATHYNSWRNTFSELFF